MCGYVYAQRGLFCCFLTILGYIEGIPSAGFVRRPQGSHWEPLLFPGDTMRTIIYVDGFNLYYGCIKGTPYKWLDLQQLFSRILDPRNEIVGIKYFTARVKSTPRNRNSPQKQQAYIRALEHRIPHFGVYYGHFLSHTVRMANANPPPNTVEVIKTEEKGSDVTLAVQLLNDAWLDAYDCAVIVSNDSDMAESMKLIRHHHPKKVLGLITPGQDTRTSEQLKQHSHFVKKIRNSILKECQLPEQIPGTTIRKPADWS